MNVLVTGAAGRLGAHVCRHLAAAGGFTVRATDKVYRRESPVRIEVAELLQRETAYRLVEGMDAVVHLAGLAGPRLGDPQKVYLENVATSFHLFQAAIEVGVKKLVFASSVQVWAGSHPLTGRGGELLPPYLPVDSEAPARPTNPYALSKHAGELMLAMYAAQCSVSTIALRFPYLVVDDVLAWLRKSRQPIQYSYKSELFAFLHGDDAAALIAAVLRAELPGARVYFPAARGNGAGRPVADVVRETYADVPLRQPLEQLTSLVDITRITRETGWEPQYNEVG